MTSSARPLRTHVESLRVRVDLIWIVGLVTLSVALRVYLLRYHPVVEQDGVHYATLARNLIQGHWSAGFSTAWSPLYPVLIALTSSAFGDIAYAGRILSAVVGGLTVIPIYLLGTRLYERRVGLMASILIAFHPTLVWYSTLVMTEALYTFLVAWLLLAGWLALHSRDRRYISLAGLLLGLAGLTRPEILGYALVLVALVFLMQGVMGRDGWRSVILRAGFLLAGMLVVLIPTALVVHHLAGRWIWAGKGSTHFLAGSWYYDPVIRAQAYAGLDSNARDISRLTFGRALSVVRANISVMAREGLPQAISPANNWFWRYATFALVVLGLLGHAWDARRLKAEVFLGAFLVYAFTVLALTLVHARLLTVTLIVFVLWMARGVIGLGHWAEDTWSVLRNKAPGPISAFSPRWVYFTTLFAVLSAFLLTSFLISIHTARHPTYFLHELEEKQIGLELKRILPQDAVLMTPMPFIPYYFYEQTPQAVKFPYAEYDQLIAYARRHEVDYIVVAEWYVQQGGFPVSFLLNEANPPPELQVVRTFFPETPGSKYILYKLQSDS